MSPDPFREARQSVAAGAAADAAQSERLGEDPVESQDWHRLLDDLQGWQTARAHLDLVRMRPDGTYDAEDLASAEELHRLSIADVRARLSLLRQFEDPA